MNEIIVKDKKFSVSISENEIKIEISGNSRPGGGKVILMYLY